MSNLHVPIGTLVRVKQKVPIKRFQSASYTSDARKGEVFIYMGPHTNPDYFIGYTFIGVNLERAGFLNSGVDTLKKISKHINQDRVKGRTPESVRRYIDTLNNQLANGYYHASPWIIRCDATDIPLTNSMKKNLLDKGE